MERRGYMLTIVINTADLASKSAYVRELTIVSDPADLASKSDMSEKLLVWFKHHFLMFIT